VKTVRFKDSKYVGDPINAVKIFNEKEADEVIVLDIDATVDAVEPNYRVIADIAAECRMPLCYGGGIRTAEQANRIIGLGVEKVALSAAAVANPALISEIANGVGNQSVVVVLDVRKRTLGRDYDVYTHNGKINTKRNLMDVIQDVQARGAGEITINDIDRDGQMKGYDLELARKVREITQIPVTFLGGAGSLDDIRSLVQTCGVVGAAAGSLFVFKGIYRAVLINYPSPAQKEAIVPGISVLSTT
jgi:cyclase